VRSIARQKLGYFPLSPTEAERIRRFLVFSGEETSALTQRLKNILSREGIRVEVLTTAVPPEAREAWYERQVKTGMQVCVAHPRLVATGLDLLQFPTLLFYESGYSIYVLRQASRRSWRIGQKQPVRVKYMAYAGTMQENCLRLMGKKLLVSLAMEGKFANHGLQALDDDDDMLTAMARELVTQKGVGEKADACWREVQREHTRVLEAQRVSVVDQPQDSVPTADAIEDVAAAPQPPERTEALVELVLPRTRAVRKPRYDTPTHNSRCCSECHSKTIPKCAERPARATLQVQRIGYRKELQMENKGPFINELPQTGEVTLLAVVLDKDLRPKRNGGTFLALRFANRSGELDGKVWDNPETVSHSFERDDVVKVRGTVEVYNDKPQIIVSRIRRCEPKENDAADFYASSARDPGRFDVEVFLDTPWTLVLSEEGQRRG